MAQDDRHGDATPVDGGLRQFIAAVTAASAPITAGARAALFVIALCIAVSWDLPANGMGHEASMFTNNPYGLQSIMAIALVVIIVGGVRWGVSWWWHCRFSSC